MITAEDIKDFQREVFCITGVIAGMSRGDAWAHIEAREGEYTENVTRATTVCVVGGRPGSKMMKAEEYGIPLMNEYEFRRLLAMTPQVDESMALRPLGMFKKIGGFHASGRPLAGETKAPSPVLDGYPIESSPVLSGSADGSMFNGQSPEEPLTVNHEPNSHRVNWAWLPELISGIAAILILLVKGLTVVCGLAICVCLWLIGIPAVPPR